MGLSTDEVDNFLRLSLAMERSFLHLGDYPSDLKDENKVPQDLSMALSTIRVDKWLTSSPARGRAVRPLDPQAAVPV